MKKITQYFIIGVLGVSFLTSCKKNAPTATSLTSVGENTNTGSVDAGTISREIYVSGIPGKIHEVRVRIKGSTSYTHELVVYLKSPSGEILQLCARESDPANNSLYPSFDVTFSDKSLTSVANWKNSNSTNFYGTFKPRGSLTSGYYVTGTITSFAGYKGGTPNGTWTLYFSDDGYFNANDAHFSSWELFLSTDN